MDWLNSAHILDIKRCCTFCCFFHRRSYSWCWHSGLKWKKKKREDCLATFIEFVFSLCFLASRCSTRSSRVLLRFFLGVEHCHTEFRSNSLMFSLSFSVSLHPLNVIFLFCLSRFFVYLFCTLICCYWFLMYFSLAIYTWAGLEQQQQQASKQCIKHRQHNISVKMQ